MFAAIAVAHIHCLRIYNVPHWKMPLFACNRVRPCRAFSHTRALFLCFSRIKVLICCSTSHSVHDKHRCQYGFIRKQTIP